MVPGLPWLWQHNSSLCLSAFTCLHLCVYESFTVYFKDTLIGFRAHLTQQDRNWVLPFISSAKTLFPIRSYSEVPGGH